MRREALSSPLLPIFLIVVVDIFGFTIVLPLLPFYAERLKATPELVGLLVATYAICQLISGPILGQLIRSIWTAAGFVGQPGRNTGGIHYDRAWPGNFGWCFWRVRLMALLLAT